MHLMAFCSLDTILSSTSYLLCYVYFRHYITPVFGCAGRRGCVGVWVCDCVCGCVGEDAVCPPLPALDSFENAHFPCSAPHVLLSGTAAAEAEAARHTCCSSGALGHTRTHTYTATRTAQSHLGMATVYLNGSSSPPPTPTDPKRGTCARAQQNRGSITDRPHHPARKYLQQQ